MVKPEGVWVVAACFNEQAVISAFIERVLAVPGVERLVLIDDGSSDDTVSQIRLWQARQAQLGGVAPVTLLELTRNFGKEAAMLAGLDHVRGECAAAVLIDSDLQHPPELIEAMVQKWRDGAEVVTAVRDDSDEESRFKVASAHWFYRVFNKLVDSIQIKEGAGDYRLLDAQALEAVTSLRESNRFSKGLLPWTGYRSVELPYQRVIRSGGQTSWSPFKLVSYAFDGIFSFSVLPLKVWTGLGGPDFLIELGVRLPDCVAYGFDRRGCAWLRLDDDRGALPGRHSVDRNRCARGLHRSDLCGGEGSSPLLHPSNSQLLKRLPFPLSPRRGGKGLRHRKACIREIARQWCAWMGEQEWWGSVRSSRER